MRVEMAIGNEVDARTEEGVIRGNLCVRSDLVGIKVAIWLFRLSATLLWFWCSGGFSGALFLGGRGSLWFAWLWCAFLGFG